MTSKNDYKEAYVWIWLPGETKPIVAGILQRVGTRLLFNYGRSYLARENAISIYEPELPLQPGEIPLANDLSMPGSIRDASPDAFNGLLIGVAGRSWQGSIGPEATPEN